MKNWLRGGATLALIVAAVFPAVLHAQTGWIPASEIIGRPVQVTTNGITNMIYFDANGAARILTPARRTVQGSWTASNGQLCLSAGGPQECWPYAAPFQAGRPVTLKSDCGSTSRWLAQSTNAAAWQRLGERG